MSLEDIRNFISKKSLARHTKSLALAHTTRRAFLKKQLASASEKKILCDVVP
jgi:hypothetical protein